MKNASKVVVFLSLFLSLFMQASLVLAAPAKPSTIPCVPNLPCIQETTQAKGGEAVRNYILNGWAVNFIKGFLGLCAITAVVFIIVGGLQLHLAVGNEEALGKAKKTLMWAIGGLVIAILSVAMVQIVSKLLVTASS